MGRKMPKEKWKKRKEKREKRGEGGMGLTWGYGHEREKVGGVVGECRKREER